MNTHRKPDILWVLFLFVSAGVTISTIAQADGGRGASRVANSIPYHSMTCRQALAPPPANHTRTGVSLYEQMLALFTEKAAACQELAVRADAGNRSSMSLSLARPGIRYGRSVGGMHTGLTLTADDRAGGVQPLLWVGVQGRW